MIELLADADQLTLRIDDRAVEPAQKLVAITDSVCTPGLSTTTFVHGSDTLNSVTGSPARRCRRCSPGRRAAWTRSRCRRRCADSAWPRRCRRGRRGGGAAGGGVGAALGVVTVVTVSAGKWAGPGARWAARRAGGRGCRGHRVGSRCPDGGLRRRAVAAVDDDGGRDRARSPRRRDRARPPSAGSPGPFSRRLSPSSRRSRRRQVGIGIASVVTLVVGVVLGPVDEGASEGVTYGADS